MSRVSQTLLATVHPRAMETQRPDALTKDEKAVALVAVATTPAWTPLFAMASAVVTDIGGPLSHSSIVAREYGIPAVMATGVATRRIPSGQIITVDGNAGTVTLSAKKDQAVSGFARPPSVERVDGQTAPS